MPTFTDTISDQLSLSESSGRNIRSPRSADDSMLLPAYGVLARAVFRHGIAASDAVGGSDSLAQFYFRAAAASDLFRMSPSHTALWRYQPIVTEGTGVRDSTNLARLVAAAEALGISPALSAAYSLRVAEGLGIDSAALAKTIAGCSVADAIRLLDGLFRFFSADISDTVEFDPTVVPTKRADGSLAVGVGVSEAVGRTLVLRITAPDSFEFEDTEALRLLFHSTLHDYVDVAAAYIAPDDEFTVWGVNAITGAVSQYDNYSFNSFANFGQMYLGADGEGLYELNGCNDEGSAIIARIKSGLAQLTESRFSMVRDAYIGMRGNGSYVLRITTGEGHTYDYAFDTESMKTVRVPLGKGMRTRYVSFELVSTGSDFDLDSVEFIPLGSTRRV